MTLTAKALEEKLNQLIGARRAKLGHLSRMIKEIEALMVDDDNAHVVSAKLSNNFTKTYMEFCELKKDVNALMCEEEVLKGQTQFNLCYRCRTS